MKKSLIPIVLTVIIFAILLLHVDYLRFVCDDAFISFRYAKNLTHGHGLVYNMGEKVEGYTNFLWTLLLSLFMMIGWDVVIVSQLLGVLFSLATIFMLLRLNRWFHPEQNLFNYLGPLFLACCGAFAAWSTGGLETSFYTFWVFLSSFLFLSGTTKPKNLAFSGITFALVCMTRLDGLIFAGVTFLFLFYLSIINRKIKVASFLLWTISFLAPFLVYFFWRWSYYGRFLPNTFYVKMGGEAFYGQGLIYLFDFVKRFRIWLSVIPLLFLGKVIKSNVNLKIGTLYFTTLILVYSLYVVYVGGDFMDMFRFLVPILPFFFFLIQEGFRGMYYYILSLSEAREPSKIKRRTLLLAPEILLIVLSLFFLAYPSKESNQLWYRQGIDSIGLLREHARIWSKVGLMFKNIAKPGESLATTAAGAIPYYSELYTIDQLGLTLADRSALRDQGALRPGHRETVAGEFLVSQKPTYILGHPQISESKEPQGQWHVSDLFLNAGYRPRIFTVKISENENMYLYCLSLKNPALK
jgi:arabinofuranosyltransferase